MEYPIEEMKSVLDVPTYLTIVSHRNPDGDAIGSSLAMLHVLKTLGHTVHVVFPSEYPWNFEWMPGTGEVTIFDVDPDEATDYIKKSEWVIALDFNSLDRIDKLGKLIAIENKKVMMIDHHIDPEPIGEFMISDTGASSTCEMVYKFLVDAGWKDRISIDVGSCLYVGLITDTGSFRHATNPDLYHIAGELKALGVDDYAIQEKVFDNTSEKQLRLLGHCLVNRMEVLPEQKTAIIALSKNDYKEFNIQRGDTEGVVNYLLKIPGIKVAAFITEQPKLVKLSLRSKGDISVQRIASENFNGGGHYNASGGYMYKPLDVVVERFKKLLPKYVNENYV